jgi:hypothetical protein
MQMNWHVLRRYRVRRANIPRDVRELFERAGERRLRQQFSHNLVPDRHDQDLLKIFESEELQQQARRWLFEQEDKDRLGRFLWNAAMTGAAMVAAAAAVWLLVAQERRWHSEDRPQVLATYLQIPPGLAKYEWTFQNTGIEDATKIRIIIATVDLTHAHQTLLTKTLDEFPRLKHGMTYPVTTEAKNDLEFLVICVNYSNDNGTRFVDPPNFYFTPFYMRDNHETRSAPAPVTAIQYDKLSVGFSCDRL